MALQCTARRMAPSGNGHEHIAYLWWKDPQNQEGCYTRDQMVAYVKQNGTAAVWCPDRAGGAGQWVHTNSNGRVEYVQTVADKRWTDNLLALPVR